MKSRIAKNLQACLEVVIVVMIGMLIALIIESP